MEKHTMVFIAFVFLPWRVGWEYLFFHSTIRNGCWLMQTKYVIDASFYMIICKIWTIDQPKYCLLWNPAILAQRIFDVEQRQSPLVLNSHYHNQKNHLSHLTILLNCVSTLQKCAQGSAVKLAPLPDKISPSTYLFLAEVLARGRKKIKKKTFLKMGPKF